jgi:hypothetical protein
MRYRLVDREVLLRKLAAGLSEGFSSWYENTLREMTRREEYFKRQPWWSEADCVGNYSFVSPFVEKKSLKDIVTMDDETCYYPLKSK